jgi:hypothetical protein
VPGHGPTQATTHEEAVEAAWDKFASNPSIAGEAITDISGFTETGAGAGAASGREGKGIETVSKAELEEALSRIELTEEEIATIREVEALGQQNRKVGADIARGGRDRTTYSERVGTWFAPVIVVPGRETPDGSAVIQSLIRFGFSDAELRIDVGGVGTSPVDIGRLHSLDVIPMNGAEKSVAKDRSGKLGFANVRAEWWWKFREALDPVLGSSLALPPDQELENDLAAPRWQLTPRGIKIESKDDIKARIGRSTDKGDAVVFAHAHPHLIGEGFLQLASEVIDDARKHAIGRQDPDEFVRSPKYLRTRTGSVRHVHHR